MKRKAEGNGLQGQGIADIRLDGGSGGNFCSDSQTGGMQDVRLLTIRILNQGKTGGTVRIVFDGHHFGERVAATALEIDNAVLALVTTTAVTGGLAAHVVTSTGAFLALGKRFFRLALGDLLEGRQRLETLRGSQRSEGFQCHGRVW